MTQGRGMVRLRRRFSTGSRFSTGGLAVLALVLLIAAISPARAQSDGSDALGGLARVAGVIDVQASWRSLAVTLPLTQPVPWRTRLLADPPRALIDFHTVDWAGVDLDAIALPTPARAIRVGAAGGGWSRLVIELSTPMGFSEAGMATNPETGGAVVSLRLSPISEAEFADQAARLLAATAPLGVDTSADVTPRAPLGQRRTLVVLDPGHGGVDPGALHNGVSEAETMLTFARELATALRRTGRYEVAMTRDSNVFVSLEARITVAHLAQADVFLSLHADALEDGQARGATLYTLADEASDEASAMLAERHDRDDLLGAGVDLTGTDDTITSILMSLARTETTPATHALARALVAAIQGADLRMHRHPWQQAAFSVLKSASVPSALLEVGFLSNDRDRGRLMNPEWRAQMVAALIAGLDVWVAEEAAQAALRRR
ncbi:N-acetylmuramoyl-L-alanine amidase [Pararhodobacter sp.]|uniref:N-acetylmuramoyl-L-alanine amidase n=1 Tax=Pararhodobacter sp. TaxID=2127056 RepID=UPI002AFF38FD|nr:N-acetylmuramoyl-L-alanine amidase [Pararhodobacter sp.]